MAWRPARRKWNTWARERIVWGTLWSSVVASTNRTWDGASSNVLSSASKAVRESWWTSSRM